MSRRKSKFESGRSMVEMLAVLAIMSLLSIGMLVGFKLMINKTKAVMILHDARLVFVEILTQEHPAELNKWLEASYASESGLKFYMMRDIKGNNYVKVEEVEGAVCEQMLPLQQGDSVAFWTEEYAPFDTCQEDKNTIVMSFDGAGLPRECNERTDCGEYFEGKCNADGKCSPCDETLEQWDEEKMLCACNSENAQTCTSEHEEEDNNEFDENEEQGEPEPKAVWCCTKRGQKCGSTVGTCEEDPSECHNADDCTEIGKSNHFCNDSGKCQACGNWEQLNEGKTGCICDATQAVTCTGTKDGQPYTWCCGTDGETNKPQICGEMADTCTISDMKCQYEINVPETRTQITNCSYRVTLPEERTMVTNCSYRVTVDGSNVTVTPENDLCPTGQYCYVAYTEPDCSHEPTDTFEGILYGTCILESTSDKSCAYSETSNITVTPENDNCPAGQYCYVAYTEPDCCHEPTNAFEGIIYGTCILESTSDKSCAYSEDSNVKATEIKGCPLNKYCYLKWMDENCETPADSTLPGTLYGACIDYGNTNPNTCPTTN